MSSKNKSSLDKLYQLSATHQQAGGDGNGSGGLKSSTKVANNKSLDKLYQLSAAHQQQGDGAALQKAPGNSKSQQSRGVELLGVTGSGNNNNSSLSQAGIYHEEEDDDDRTTLSLIVGNYDRGNNSSKSYKKKKFTKQNLRSTSLERLRSSSKERMGKAASAIRRSVSPTRVVARVASSSENAPFDEERSSTASSRQRRASLGGSTMKLPPGWKVAKDGATLKNYYYHTSSGEVTWDMPTFETPGEEEGNKTLSTPRSTRNEEKSKRPGLKKKENVQQQKRQSSLKTTAKYSDFGNALQQQQQQLVRQSAIVTKRPGLGKNNARQIMKSNLTTQSQQKRVRFEVDQVDNNKTRPSGSKKGRSRGLSNKRPTSPTSFLPWSTTTSSSFSSSTSRFGKPTSRRRIRSSSPVIVTPLAVRNILSRAATNVAGGGGGCTSPINLPNLSNLIKLVNCGSGSIGDDSPGRFDSENEYENDDDDGLLPHNDIIIASSGTKLVRGKEECDGLELIKEKENDEQPAQEECHQRSLKVVKPTPRSVKEVPPLEDNANQPSTSKTTNSDDEASCPLPPLMSVESFEVKYQGGKKKSASSLSSSSRTLEALNLVQQRGRVITKKFVKSSSVRSSSLSRLSRSSSSPSDAIDNSLKSSRNNNNSSSPKDDEEDNSQKEEDICVSAPKEEGEEDNNDELEAFNLTRRGAINKKLSKLSSSSSDVVHSPKSCGVSSTQSLIRRSPSLPSLIDGALLANGRISSKEEEEEEDDDDDDENEDGTTSIDIEPCARRSTSPINFLDNLLLRRDKTSSTDSPTSVGADLLTYGKKTSTSTTTPSPTNLETRLRQQCNDVTAPPIYKKKSSVATLTARMTSDVELALVEKKEKTINAAEPAALVKKKNKETTTAAAAAPLEKKESVATLTGRSSSDVELALIKKNGDSNDSAVLARTSPTPTPVASSSSGSRRISEYKSLPPPTNPSDTFEVKLAPGATLSSMSQALHLQRRAIQQQLEDDEASDAEEDNNNGSILGLGDDNTIASSAVVSSDLNSMSAIYSQDEDKMFDRKTCNEGIINVRGNVLDDINSISAESELTTDLSDIHNYSREGKEKKTDKNEWLQRQPSRDCNYGTTLETAYEDFGVERQLAVVSGKGKKTKVRQGIIPKVTQKLKLLKPCNPVNVDEVSTTMTSIADSSVKSANVDDDEDDELVPYDSLNWLCGGDCGENNDWDCGDVDEYTTYTTTTRGTLTTRGNLTNDISQEEEEEGKIDDIFDNINLGFDVFTGGNVDKDQSTEEYYCQTEYDCLTEAISEYEPKTIDTGVVDDDASCHGVAHEQKEAVADTEAIRMQGLIFVAPNVDKSTVQEGYFQSATPP